MGNSVKYLPTLEELKKQITKNPSLLEYYRKYHNFIGSIESVEYINKKLRD
jgi:hypothetical protein